MSKHTRKLNGIETKSLQNTNRMSYLPYSLVAFPVTSIYS